MLALIGGLFEKRLYNKGKECEKYDLHELEKFAKKTQIYRKSFF